MQLLTKGLEEQGEFEWMTCVLEVDQNDSNFLQSVGLLHKLVTYIQHNPRGKMISAIN